MGCEKRSKAGARFPDLEASHATGLDDFDVPVRPRRRLNPAKLKLTTPWPGVQETVRLQLVGPLLLLCVVAAAESIAYALAHNPSSALLWYLNLEVFSIFRKSRVAL